MDEKEKLITCPYDASHRVKQYRMFRHLTKCEKQHSHMKLETCPFNSLHRIKPLEFQHHLLKCKNRANAASLLCSSEPTRSLNTITVQEVNEIQQYIPQTETWSIEPEHTQSYNPLEHIKDKNILYSIICASKTEKLRFKQKERERHSSITNNSSTSVPKDEVPKLKDELEKPLRLPRYPPQILMKTKEKNDNNSIGSNANKMDKTNKRLKYMDEDLIAFQKSKDSLECTSNSVNKNDNMIKALNSTNGTDEKTINYPRGLEKSIDRRCSFGRGISIRGAPCNIDETSKNNSKSNYEKPLVDTSADIHDYTGTFYGYEEESELSLKELQDELTNISNY